MSIALIIFIDLTRFPLHKVSDDRAWEIAHRICTETEFRCYSLKIFSCFREYFEDRIGPVSFDFVKTSADQQRLFVAVRFETRDDAKEAMAKYSDSELLGHRCELTWFKDIRRYAQYQSMNQNRRTRPVYRNRSHHQSSRGRDSHKRRHSERDDDRSRSRSKDRGRSSSDSRSPSGRSVKSSRSRSRSSDRGANDERDRRSPSNDTGSDREKEKDSDGDPEKKRSKKSSKHRKSKKKRSRTGSQSSSEGISSTPERAIFGKHAPAGSPVSPNQEESAAQQAATQENTEAEPPFPPPMVPVASGPVRFPIRIHTPANVINNTSFTFGIESVSACILSSIHNRPHTGDSFDNVLLLVSL
ncbi:hypothetical protein COOONC_27267 [Cooperia oncophora]